jgi:hypothetical protein
VEYFNENNSTQQNQVVNHVSINHANNQTNTNDASNEQINDQELTSFSSDLNIDFVAPIIFVNNLIPMDYAKDDNSNCDFFIKQQTNHIQSGIKQVQMNDKYHCHIELLKILKHKGVPLYIFEEIMNWANKSVKYKAYNFAQSFYTRKTVISTLFHQYNLNGIKPTKISLNLPSNNQRVDVVIHDIKQCIYSLLCDPFLNHDNKYYFKNFPTPRIPKLRDNSIITDFYNGKSFCDAENTYLSNAHVNDMIVPICLFIDKTHATENGRFTCEPVSMCLMLYDVETRNLPQAWRTIGYIINQADSDKKTTTSYLKLIDYHECLSLILGPLHKLQMDNGFNWKIPFKGLIHDVEIKIPILFIAGNNEGLDKLASRYGSQTGKVKSICRFCDIPLEKAGSPTHKFVYLTNEQMVNYVNQNNHQRLSQLLHHLLNNNIFHKMLFCHQKRGFRAALPFDILHTVQLGWMMYIIEGVLNTQTLSATEQQREENQLCNSQNDEQYYNAKDDENKQKTKWNVFSVKRKKEFDVLAKLYGISLKRQSD